jgi:hypothetical protein
MARLDQFQLLLNNLDGWLNGSVFPLSDQALTDIGEERLQQVAAVFRGDTPEGQQHLDFDAYDFGYIPIETLSVIYQQFLHAAEYSPGRSEGRERGAYYTPVDIEVRAIEVGPKPRFRFEAKRLTSNRSVRAYLGKDGLQMYIGGEYAAEQDDAGMLGYVQTGEPKTWAAQLDAQLKSKPEEHAVCAGGEWSNWSLAAEIPLTFRSVHIRLSIGRPLVVFHTLLDFSRRDRSRTGAE